MKLCVACGRAYQCGGEEIPLSVWSVGNLTSTALGPLQSETSDSGDSVEQIQKQMEEIKKKLLYLKTCHHKLFSFLSRVLETLPLFWNKTQMNTLVISLYRINGQCSKYMK